MSGANLNRETRTTCRVQPFKQKLRESDITITAEDKVRFDEYARRWRLYGAYSSSSSVFDMIKSIAVAYAILSGHRRITCSEFRILDMLESYLRNPNESVRLKILELAHQSRSVSDICSILNEDYDSYHPFVSRVIGEYCRRGVLTRRVD
jgi:hypothetical protein